MIDRHPLSGRHLAEQALAIRTGLKVLFMSGYTDDEVLDRGIMTAAVHFIRKPFTSAELRRQVRETLDAKR